MKRISKILIAVMVAFAINSCSDSDNFDPYGSQNNRPFYPTAISFNSASEDATLTDRDWSFTYNGDQTVRTYKYERRIRTIKGSEIEERHSGELTYYTDAAGGKGILNKSVVHRSVSDLLSVQSYSDTITEDVKILSGLIHSIKTIGRRTYTNGSTEVYSSMRDFTYTDKYCTSSTLTDAGGVTTYRYDWGNAQLKKVTVYEQDKDNNISQYVYSYTYSNRELGTDYGFNTLAFVYGNMPEIYAAMNLFGATSAYRLEGESYSGFREIAGVKHNISPVNKNYTIMETSNNVTYAADSPGFSTYIFNFKQ